MSKNIKTRKNIFLFITLYYTKIKVLKLIFQNFNDWKRSNLFSEELYFQNCIIVSQMSDIYVIEILI